MTGSVNTREPVGCKLRAHSRQYTLERNTPRTLWRPIEGYLLTFDKGIALQRERANGRAFTLLLRGQTLWPLQRHRLYRLFNLSDEPLLVGWLSRDGLQAMLLVDSTLAYDCIRQMNANSNELTIMIGQQMQRTALSYLAGTLLTLWEWSDRHFIHCTQAELAMVLKPRKYDGAAPPIAAAWVDSSALQANRDCQPLWVAATGGGLLMNDQTQLVRRLERGGLRVQQSFAWQMDKTLGHNCPTHKSADCDCQMAIYLVYGEATRPATLLVHSGDGRTRIKLDQSVGQRVSAEFQSQIITALHAA